LTEQLQNFNKDTRVHNLVGKGRARNVVINIITIIIKHIVYRNNFNLEENKEPDRFEKGFALTPLNSL
jgi:hypothetical protein